MILASPMIDDLRAFAQSLAPEIPPPRIVFATRDELEEYLPAAGPWDGLCCPSESLAAKEFRQLHGIEAGGALIALDTADVDDLPALRTLVVHEQSHAARPPRRKFQLPQLPPPKTAAAERDFAREIFASTLYRTESPLWIQDHGIEFIRRCLHLASRAVEAGYTITLRDLCAGPTYGLSHPAAYLEALGNEPERMATWKIATIEAAAPPAAFLELWEADKAAHYTEAR